MKKRVVTFALAMLMLGSLALTGCAKKEAPAAADQVAVAIFDLILRDDATAVIDLFGYASEDEARKDMGIEGSVYDDLADNLVTAFGSMGITATAEDAQTFVDAFLNMYKNVKLTAKVKESDEKAGTAVVTCTINTFDSNVINEAMTQVITDISSDPEMLAGDEAAMYSAVLNKMSEAISGLEPTENTKDFDVDFTLEKRTINGKERQVWLPKDVNEFGNAIGSNAMGG